MAGVKGKSGGARPNAGGKREGAGRKAKPASVLPQELTAQRTEEGAFDPRPTLELVAQGLLEVSVSQQKALTALLPYVHGKKGEGGKKEQRQEAAQKVAGRFSAASPPKLAAVGGRKL